MKTILFILAMLCFAAFVDASAKGSLKTANWCFGNRGFITFKNGFPEELNSSSIRTHEGVATISDDNGNLLFYTDGQRVYNAQHDLMPNGYGLEGHSSSSQSGVIVPFPGNYNKYYIFTVDDIWSSTLEYEKYSGFCYSVVDMTKDNNQGDVIEKNVSLFTPSCEKITAVGAYNGKGIWLIGQKWNNNKIVVYLIDKNGVHFHKEFTINALTKFDQLSWTKGCMKFSPNGDMLAVANNGVSLALYDFDIKTGELSNERFSNLYQYRNSYGVEFSPNSKYLYISSVPFGDNESPNERDINYVLQVDLEKVQNDGLDNSYTELANFTYNFGETDAHFGSMQIALDGKIYLSSHSRSRFNISYHDFLSVINKPNEQNCDFQYRGLLLKNNSVSLGLPTFIQSFLRPDFNNFATSDYCDGDDIVLHAEYYKDFKYKWVGPNGFQTDTCDTIIKSPSSTFAGKYVLFITDTNKYVDSTIYMINYHKTDIVANIIDTNEYKFVTGYYTKTLQITNNYIEEAGISKLYFKSNTNYNLEPLNLPFSIYGNETRNYIINVNTSKSRKISDTLVIEVEQPCPFYKEIALNDIISPINLHIQLPDTTVELGKSFKNNIIAYLEPIPDFAVNFDIDFTFSYSSYLYSPLKTQTNSYTLIHEKSKDLISFSLDSFRIKDSTIKITDLKARTLLCSEYETPLTFTNASISDSAINLILHDGSIKVNRNDCTKDLFTIQGGNFHIAYGQPTQNDGVSKIILYSPDKGTLKLSIFSSIGIKVAEYQFDSQGDFAKEIQPNFSSTASGIYFLVWESPQSIYTTTILINK